MALIGLLFASWQPKFEELIAKPRPAIYKNRKSYIQEIFSVFLTRAIPLLIFIGSYVFSLSGVALNVLKYTSFSINPTLIQPAPTLFALTYLLAIFLLLLSAASTLRLLLAWWNAGKDRGSSAKVTLFR